MGKTSLLYAEPGFEDELEFWPELELDSEVEFEFWAELELELDLGSNKLAPSGHSSRQGEASSPVLRWRQDG